MGYLRHSPKAAAGRPAASGRPAGALAALAQHGVPHGLRLLVWAELGGAVVKQVAALVFCCPFAAPLPFRCLSSLKTRQHLCRVFPLPSRLRQCLSMRASRGKTLPVPRASCGKAPVFRCPPTAFLRPRRTAGAIAGGARQASERGAPRDLPSLPPRARCGTQSTVLFCCAVHCLTSPRHSEPFCRAVLLSSSTVRPRWAWADRLKCISTTAHRRCSCYLSQLTGVNHDPSFRRRGAFYPGTDSAFYLSPFTMRSTRRSGEAFQFTHKQCQQLTTAVPTLTASYRRRNPAAVSTAMSSTVKVVAAVMHVISLMAMACCTEEVANPV